MLKEGLTTIAIASALAGCQTEKKRVYLDGPNGWREPMKREPWDSIATPIRPRQVGDYYIKEIDVALDRPDGRWDGNIDIVAYVKIPGKDYTLADFDKDTVDGKVVLHSGEIIHYNCTGKVYALKYYSDNLLLELLDKFISSKRLNYEENLYPNDFTFGIDLEDVLLVEPSDDLMPHVPIETKSGPLPFQKPEEVSQPRWNIQSSLVDRSSESGIINYYKLVDVNNDGILDAFANATLPRGTKYNIETFNEQAINGITTLPAGYMIIYGQTEELADLRNNQPDLDESLKDHIAPERLEEKILTPKQVELLQNLISK